MEEKYKPTLSKEDWGIFGIELCSISDRESVAMWYEHYHRQCLIRRMYMIEDNPKKKEKLKKAFLHLKKMEVDPKEKELSKEEMMLHLR